ncbi:MAG: SIMPL domain-containing protein [Pacificimonas sp.]|jgi:uncharacterized protein YggE|nr:SIMPL domain-containing protein [Pacificimonas sp.]
MTRFLPALAVVTALTAAGPAAAQEIEVPVSEGATLLTISAAGEVRAAPDIATISAGVVSRAKTAQAAMQDNRQRMDRVVNALRDAGIERRDIQTRQLRLNPDYRYRENEPPVISGYQAQNQVSVTVRELGTMGSVLDALVAVGANQFNGPSFSVEDSSAAQDEARADALRTAMQRANLYAGAAGLSVARIISITEGGGMNPRPPQIMVTATRSEMAADAVTPVEAGELTLGAMVTVQFELR